MSEGCIFCRIVAGELPSAKVYEDEDTLAFMDIGPVTKGHTLVIPKQHCDPITGAPAQVLQKLILTVQKVAAAHLDGLHADGVNVTQANGKIAGQIVPHLHFHIIPRYENRPDSRNWIPGEYASPEEMHQLAATIADAIGQGREGPEGAGVGDHALVAVENGAVSTKVTEKPPVVPVDAVLKPERHDRLGEVLVEEIPKFL